MMRTERLVIRLNRAEAAAVDRLAEAERLPVSTLARRLLLLEAEKPRRSLPAPRIQSRPASEAVRP